MTNSTMYPAPASRRGFLRTFAGFVGAGAVGGVAEAAPLAAAPPSASSKLQDLDRHLQDLLFQRGEAVNRRAEAQNYFFAHCPHRPRELIASEHVVDRYQEFVELEVNAGPELWNHGPGSPERLIYSARRLAEAAPRFARKSPSGRWIEKRLRLADSFETESARLAAECGYDDASAGYKRIVGEITAIATCILQVEPQSLSEIVIHARSISTLADFGHRGYWPLHDGSALRLMAALLRLPAA